MPRPLTPPSRAAFAILVALLVACLLGGGSNRADIAALLLLRPLAALAAGVLVLLGAGPRAPAAPRVLWWLVAAGATLAALQLVPLPPALWSHLPGRAPFMAAAAIIGAPQPWRPISVAPDMTWNSLASLLIPVAVLLGCSAVPDLARRGLPWAIALAGASALLGVVQLVGGAASGFYLYPGTAEGLPIGFLANRNHQGLLLAILFPLLAAWCRTTDAKGRPGRHRQVAAGMAALMLAPVILATGSRSGLAQAGVATLAALALLPWRRIDARRRRPAMIAAVGALCLTVAVTALAGRALVFDRLSRGGDLSSEMRVASAPTTLRLLEANLPFGAGLGAFDAVFRMAEPDALLNPNYLNHAHDDLLELGVTAGLPGLAILAAFVAWLARAGWILRQMPDDDRRARGWAGWTSIVLMLLASLSDYPLRVPFLQALFVLFAAWVATATRARSLAGAGSGVAFRQASL